MKSKNIVICLKQVGNFLKVEPGKFSYNEDGLCTHLKNNCTTKGVFNIINEFLKESHSNLGGSTFEDKIFIRQYIEYAMLYVSSDDNSSNVFQTLNEVFARKTYLLGTKLSIADVFLYYMILNKMANLTHLEKDKYLNVCRWFDNIQQNALIRQSNPLVNFSTIHLVSNLPAKHC